MSRIIRNRRGVFEEGRIQDQRSDASTRTAPCPHSGLSMEGVERHQLSADFVSTHIGEVGVRVRRRDEQRRHLLRRAGEMGTLVMGRGDAADGTDIRARYFEVCHVNSNVRRPSSTLRRTGRPDGEDGTVRYVAQSLLE